MKHSAEASARSRRGRRAPARARRVAAGPAQPDAAGRPGPSRRAGLPRRLRAAQLPYWIAIIGVALALISMRESSHNVRGGTLALAGVLLAAAVARLALPERRAGMLVSRRRLADVAMLTALGAGLLVAGLVLPAQS